MSELTRTEGTNESDEIIGDNGGFEPAVADWLLGLGGDDALYGGQLDDKLEGGDGNDNLFGGSGNDLLDGGAGNDIASFEGVVSDYRIIKLDADTYEVKYVGTAVTNGGTDEITKVENVHFISGGNFNAGVSIGDAPRGAVTVGEGETEGTLEANIDVQGGATPENISYQWMRNGEQISVSDSATYTLTAADDGQEITVVAHYVVGTGLDTWRFESVSSNRAPTVVTTANGTLDRGAVKDDGTLLMGTGIPADNMNIVTHNNSGIELGLKAFQYKGDYGDGSVVGNTYHVQDGVSALNTGRADWSFAMTVEEGLNGSGLTVGDETVKGDFDVGIYLDIDPTDAENFVHIGNLEEIGDSETTNANAFQNAWNIGFDFLKEKLDAYGAGDFNGSAKFGLELRLTDVITDSVVTKNEINVIVNAGGTEDTTYEVSLEDLLAGYGDDVSIAELPTAGGAQVVLNEAGTAYTITPAANFNGTLTLSYKVKDTAGSTVDATRTIVFAAVNDAPTGGVTITGTATEGQELTASHNLVDADGLGPVSYQWLRGGEAIADANGTTYTLTQADVGAKISVVASYTDAGGADESRTSGDTDAVANVNDAPTGGVTITGTATQGQELTASHNLADEDGLGPVSYQWLRGGEAIAGATGTTYTLTQADVGKAISVKASFTDEGGADESSTSTATNTVANVNDGPTGGVSIVGTATQGQELTASHNLADEDGLGLVSYQWLRGGEAIAGATGTTYTLTQADVGKAISVKASYTDEGGADESKTSTATDTVANINDGPTGGVSITGTATQGQELTASHNLADADGLGLVSYQWLRGGEAIAGATGTTYTLTQADVGKAISVKASYTDEGGANESKTSTATDAVADANAAPTGGVSITGTATQGQVLTAWHNLADEDGLGPVSYQWLRDGEAIEDATGTTYTLTQTDVGKAISVKASYTDEGGADENRTSAATAAVADVNEAPIFASSTAAVDFVEGATAVAYTAAATDADNQTVLTYGISGADAFLFNINTSTGAVTFKHAPDFEAPADTGKDNVYNIAVTATDGIETATQAVTITVTDANEAPTDIILSSTAAWENLEAGGVIAAITGTDSNIGDALSFSIVDGENCPFSIVDGKLVLRDDASLDREAAGNHKVTIRVEDGNGGTFDKEFTIEVKDVAEGDADDEIINGADTDHGGGGVDKLTGGAGDDIFITDGGDTIVEAIGQGDDTVRSTVAYTLGVNLENLVLLGSNAINGTGNSLANVITGNANKNVLNGGTGADTLKGGKGDDTYVTDGGDTITEALDEGTDTVQSSATVVALSANVESLVLTGSAAINGTGNALDNVITGNGGANTLNGGDGDDAIMGGLGKDKLIGGAGDDAFVFNTKASSTNIDAISDFTAGVDTITLENAIFTAFKTVNGLAANAFASNTTGKATDKYDRIVYESDTGKLFYDADGNGKGAAIQFATLSKNLTLTHDDFWII